MKMSTTKFQEEQSLKLDEKPQPLVQSSQVPSHMESLRVKTLDVKYSNRRWTKADIIDPETNNVIYTAAVKGLLQAKMEFFEPGSTSPMGEAVFHLHTSRVDLVIRGQKLKLEVPHILSSKHTYHSPALENQKITWESKCRMKTINYTCVDERQMPVAKVETEISSALVGAGGNKVEIVGSFADNKAAKEEILFAALSLSWAAMVQITAAIVA